jgi:heat shock protein
MAVVGVDIGEYSTHISVACLGGVETIANDYSLRDTPTVVAVTDRQRFVGVAAESQRSLHPENTLSYFKSVLGRPFKAVEHLELGAPVKQDAQNRVVFELRNGQQFCPEQVMAMVFTKVKDLVAAAAMDSSDKTAAAIETCVVSVPIYFTHAQRLAVRDAAAIAGLHLDAVVTDIAALALAYGKTKNDLPPLANSNNSEQEQAAVNHNSSSNATTTPARYVVIVDCGAEGTQAALLAVHREQATVLASSANHIGGKVFDKALRDHFLAAVREKYGQDLSTNLRAVTKLNSALERVKKQMSANANRLPFTVDSLLEDTDVQLSIERAEFEQLIHPALVSMKQSLENLLESTTVRRDQIHSVEVVGGSSRIPAVRALLQEVFGLPVSTSMNADEAVSRGCALRAASLSSRFVTRRFDVQDAVLHGVEALFVHGGVHERSLVYDEGDSAAEERRMEIEADLPLNIALQYAEEAAVDNKFIALYQVNCAEVKNGTVELRFGFDAFSTIELREVALISKDMSKRRRTSESRQEAALGDQQQRQEAAGAAAAAGELSHPVGSSRTSLSFSRSVEANSNLSQQQLSEMSRQEAELVARHREEVARQEERNLLEEELYQVRDHVLARLSADNAGGEQLAAEDATQRMRSQLDELETWLYQEEGETAPRATYAEARQQLAERKRIYSIWCDKFLAMKAKEAERLRFLEQQDRKSGGGGNRGRSGERQIPVVYEGTDGSYVPKSGAEGRSPGSARGFAGNRGFAGRRPGGTFPRGDPFRGFGPSEFFDPMFGW